MAGEEEKKDLGQGIQTGDQGKFNVLPSEMSPDELRAMAAVLQKDQKYYAQKSAVAAAVNRLKEAGRPITEESIIEEFERAAIVGVAPESEKESNEQLLRNKIEEIRLAVKRSDALFTVLHRNIEAHVSQFPKIESMTAENRVIEFGLLNPATNTDAGAFFREVNAIDFSIDGEAGLLYKKMLAEKKAADPETVKKEYAELQQICAHDLAQCVRVIKSNELVLSRVVREEHAKESANAGSGDLGKVRRFWVAMERAWQQGSLLQEDLNTRFMKKDEVLPELQEETTLERVLDTLQSGVQDERRSKIEGNFTVDEAAKKAKVKLNEGALYFILRNIAYNPIRKPYIEATKVDVRVAVTDGKESVVIEIEDNGVGIDPAMKLRVFNRGETGASQSSEGLGLGLAYSDKRLQSMGISVDIISDRSVPKEEDPAKFGAKFVVTIPIAEGEVA